MADLAKIVLLRAKPERVADLEATLRRLLSATRQEAASTACELHRSSEEEAQFMVYERWSDDAGFARHMEQPHTFEFLALAGDLLAEPPQVLSFDTLP
ncbi:putative quinol monooxygenase [Novosphingobium soli]|uniref:Quinol monooxygenase n=1 Tax=Novosphingobium soli TaxID=574956 RepID=A0ABV6CRS3_9SPHN